MIPKAKPPDYYKCLKIPLKNILTDDTPIEIIQNAINRANNLSSNTYILLRLWVLHKYHNKEEIPKITKSTISACMQSLLKHEVKLTKDGEIKKSQGRPPKENKELINEFKSFNTFLPLEDGKNLGAILGYYQTTMLTAIENNIKLHFFDYVRRYINSYFKHKRAVKIAKRPGYEKNMFQELKQVKIDIINGTLQHNLKCHVKYHRWLLNRQHKIMPVSVKNVSYPEDIKRNPSKYLKHMIYMCLSLERRKVKSFQFFPIQSTMIPRHVQIDTKAIIELFISVEKHKSLIDMWLPPTMKTRGKGGLLKCIINTKEFIWATFFNIKPKMKNYVFDHTIITDGYAVSLRFIHKDYVDVQKETINKRQTGRATAAGKSTAEKEAETKAKEDAQILHDAEPKKKLTKEEIEKMNFENAEFHYIDEIDINLLKGKTKKIFIDPGKRSLFTMMDENHKFLSYTNKCHIKATKRLKYQKVLMKHKKNVDILKLEKEFINTNSKSCRINKFMQYVNVRVKTRVWLSALYQDIKFRQYAWYAYINKKRTEDKMINMIVRTYSKDHIIIIGDWSIKKSMRHFISTPNLTLKRKLQKHFTVYNIDEFRTSMLSHVTEKPCDNLQLYFKKDGVTRSLHPVLTYKMENNQTMCINRDKNSCRNIQKIFDYYIDTGNRPLHYRREYTFPEKPHQLV